MILVEYHRKSYAFYPGYQNMTTSLRKKKNLGRHEEGGGIILRKMYRMSPSKGRTSKP